MIGLMVDRNQNISLILSLVLIIVAGIFSNVNSTNYYLDSVSGSDSDIGTLPNRPWKSLNKLSQKLFSPGDPLLTAIGSGRIGYDTVNGYKLNRNSPCIGRGLHINQMKGNYWLPDLGVTDFLGNRLPKESINIGACQSRY